MTLRGKERRFNKGYIGCAMLARTLHLYSTTDNVEEEYDEQRYWMSLWHTPGD